MTFWDGNGWVNEVPARSKSTLSGHRVSLVALVIVGALAIGALPLLVTGASPTLTISPTRAVGGVTVTLAGMGFVPRTTVQVVWDGSTKGMPTASVTGQGRFKVSISVPPTASAGSHTVSVSGTTSGRVATDANVVTEIASASVLVQSGSIASAGRSTTVSRTAKPDGPEKPSTTKSPRGGSGPAASWTAMPSATPGAAPSISSSGTGFVARCGRSLCLNGSPWYLFGASQLGGLDDPNARAEMAVSANLNTIRIVNFLDEKGALATAPYESWRWQRVDRAIASAHGRGLKVILDLSTYRNLLSNAGLNPYTHDWGAFISFVANRRNTVTGVRYADDPTIAIVAFAGEVEPVNSTANSLGVTTLQVTNFFKKAFASWQAIDPNHLLSSGGLLQLDWNSGIDWRTIFALPGSDLCSIHDYSRADQTITTPAVASYCASIGRPWITEEFGWEQATGDLSRSRDFAAMYGLQSRYAAAGVAFWNLGPQTSGATYDVNSATALTWAAVRSNAP